MTATQTETRATRSNNNANITDAIRQLMRRLHLMFDYDNTLGLTEYPAFTACCRVVNATLLSKGVAEDKLFTTETLMARFVGYSFRRMITDLAVEHNFDFDEGMEEVIGGEVYRPELEILVKREEVAVIDQLATDIQPTDGVNAQLADLQSEGYEMSVVSSSAERRVRACLKGAEQEGYFASDRIFSAANYKSSKPDPRVYLEALKAMNLNAEDCVAIEDSKTGATAAIAAGITVIGYLGAYPEDERNHLREVLSALGVAVIIDDWSEFETALAQVACERFGVTA